MTPTKPPTKPPTKTSFRRVAPAFTLIEVLIAVLVLGLGVLGLGAVFSVGIPQQQIASDQVQGLNAIESARAVLLGNERLNNPVNPGFPDSFQTRGWYGLQQHVGDLDDSSKTWSRSGEWMLPLREPGNLGEAWMSLDPVASGTDKDVGEVVIGSPNLDQTAGQLNVRIPIAQRLVPAPYTPQSEPQYVWDFVVRRVPSGQADANTGLPTPSTRDQLEVVVFVRRVDPGIRVPLTRREDQNSRVELGERLRLSDYLTMNAAEITGDQNGVIANTQRIVPVSMNPDSSQPRLDGRTLAGGGGGSLLGEYAVPFGIGVGDVARYPGQQSGPGDDGRAEIARDRLPLMVGGGGGADDENRLRLATEIGHKIVDRFGNVYEVRGVDQDLTSQFGVMVVRISPPVPSDVSSPADFRYPGRSDLDGQAFITTPQKPVAVDVFRVRP